jgi:hypothetical protein
MPSSWTNKDPSGTLRIFQEGLPVRLIATDRNAFKICTPNDALVDVVARNREDLFDYFPVTVPATDVTDTRDRIVGLVEIAPYMHGTEPQGLVEDIMRPLSEEILIGADASIWAFVRDADFQRFRFVVSGPEISGLVSLSDLQRLPVRAALFAMVTHFEMVMAEVIRSEFERDGDWVRRLSQGRQEKLRDKVTNAKSEDSYVDMLLYTEFCDKIAIIKSMRTLPGTKSSFESDLRKVQSLRDNLAHANDFAATRNDAENVSKTVRLMEHWTDELMELLFDTGRHA